MRAQLLMSLACSAALASGCASLTPDQEAAADTAFKHHRALQAGDVMRSLEWVEPTEMRGLAITSLRCFSTLESLDDALRDRGSFTLDDLASGDAAAQLFAWRLSSLALRKISAARVETLRGFDELHEVEINGNSGRVVVRRAWDDDGEAKALHYKLVRDEAGDWWVRTDRSESLARKLFASAPLAPEAVGAALRAGVVPLEELTEGVRRGEWQGDDELKSAIEAHLQRFATAAKGS